MCIRDSYYGWEVFDDVLREAAKALKRLLGTLFSTGDLIAINRPSGSEFYVFLSVPPRAARLPRAPRGDLRGLDEGGRARGTPEGAVQGRARAPPDRDALSA